MGRFGSLNEVPENVKLISIDFYGTLVISNSSDINSDEVKPRKDVEEFLKYYYDKKIPIVISSDTKTKIIKKELNGLEKYITKIYGSENTHYSKKELKEFKNLTKISHDFKINKQYMIHIGDSAQDIDTTDRHKVKLILVPISELKPEFSFKNLLPKKETKIKNLKRTVKECFKQIKNKELGRIVLQTNKTNLISPGNWLNTKNKTYYHPASFSNKEQNAVDEKTSYEILALTNGKEQLAYKSEKVLGQSVMIDTNIDDIAIEITNRIKTTTNIDPSEINNDYTSTITIIPRTNKEGINEIINYMYDKLGLRSSTFKKLFEQGVKEYHNSTIKMMEKSGAITSRENLDKKYYFETKEDPKLIEEIQKIISLENKFEPLYKELDKELELVPIIKNKQ